MTSPARKPAFKQCDVERAMRAVLAVGCSISGVEITRAGAIRVLTAAGALPSPSNDTGDWTDDAGEAEVSRA